MAKSYINKQNSETVFELGNLAMMSSAIKTETGHEGVNKSLQIANTLQTTLDIEQMIKAFSAEINHLISHNSISLINQQQNIDISLGKAARHSCSYQLVAAGQSLGQLTLTRSKKYTNNETVFLEYLLCSLVYPLRNALLYKQAVNAALKDPLTGANNRSSMNATIIRETELARRHNTPLSLIALDIDNFKKINDGHGHAAGDYILQSVADAIRECIRSSDIFFRYGGEEFIVLLSNTEKKGAWMLSERIRCAIEAMECDYQDTIIPVTASLGVSCYDCDDNSESLFEKADIALYSAKADGRNCVRFFNSDKNTSKSRHSRA